MPILSKKVVIVEDEPSISLMYKLKLQTSGYDVRTAANGEAGLLIIEEFRPDLILLDLKMPVMNGEEMLLKLRATHWGSNIRVIILTNISKNEAPMALRFLSVNRYLIKAHHTPAQVRDITDEILGQPE